MNFNYFINYIIFNNFNSFIIIFSNIFKAEFLCNLIVFNIEINNILKS